MAQGTKNANDVLGDAYDPANNAIKVNHVAGTGGTSMVDDAAFTVGSTSVTPLGAMLDDVASDSVDEGDVGVPRMTANRIFLVAIADPTTPTQRGAVSTLGEQLVRAGQPSNATLTVYATNLVVKGSAGTLFGLTGYNAKASAQFVQVHDAAALPSEGAAPVVVFTVPASSNFALDFGIKGRSFGTGIVVCNSSTGPTKTIGSADLWVDAQYV